MSRASFVGVALAGILAVSPLNASSPDAASPPVTLDMEMTYSGFDVGDVTLLSDASGGPVVTRIDLRSTGLVRLLTGSKGWAEAATQLDEEGDPQPSRYDSYFETRRYNRQIMIRYDEQDGDVSSLQTLKRGQPQDSEVPPAMRNGTIDPMTLLFALRHWLVDRDRAETSTVFEVFDGRRRYDVAVSLLDRVNMTFAGEKRWAIRLRLVMEPLAGFDDDDLLIDWVSQEGEEKWIEALISDDELLIPLRLRTRGGGITSEQRTDRICDGSEPCVDGRSS
ncbi:MAG: DUF3108 domain-containing protein [Geminicoccaceae bacterium]